MRDESGACVLKFLFLAAFTVSTIPTWAATNSNRLAPSTASTQSQNTWPDEAPPPPEPPYPGSENGPFSADADEPTTSSGVKAATALTRERTEPEPLDAREVPRPKKVDDDGNFYYDTTPTAPVVRRREGIEIPKSATEDGLFIYDTKEEIPKFSGQPGIEAPTEMRANGEYHYKLEQTVSKASASFRMGAMTPPAITNPDNKLNFAKVYGDSPLPVLLLDYEFRLTSKIGRLGLKAGSGLAVTQGQGHFRNPSRAAEVPDERYTFVLFPNTLTAVYKFQYAERQLIVPYIEGGAGYFTFAEIRDDGARPKIGGALTGVAAGGLSILLDRLDPHAIRALDAEYGINHIWLTIEARQIVGLNSVLDFTSTAGNAGFIMEF